jgi:hypothetical protein
MTNRNPLLGPLVNNGGTTQTHALLANSPVLNAADPVTSPPVDQRGIARPQYGMKGAGDRREAMGEGGWDAGRRKREDVRRKRQEDVRREKPLLLPSSLSLLPFSPSAVLGVGPPGLSGLTAPFDHKA